MSKFLDDKCWVAMPGKNWPEEWEEKPKTPWDDLVIHRSVLLHMVDLTGKRTSGELREYSVDYAMRQINGPRGEKGLPPYPRRVFEELYDDYRRLVFSEWEMPNNEEADAIREQGGEA